MCGIGAIIAKNMSVRQKLFAARMLAIGLVERGTDSFGIANENGYVSRVVKRNIKEFILSNGFKQVVNTGNLIVIHTRQATHGKVNYDNAQPFLDRNLVLAHNGILYDRGLVKSKHSDTKLFFLSLKETPIKEALLDEDGFMAFLIIDKREKTLYAYKEGAPLVMATDKQGNRFFASEARFFEPLVTLNIQVQKTEILQEYEMVKLDYSGQIVSDVYLDKVKSYYYGTGGLNKLFEKEDRHLEELTYDGNGEAIEDPDYSSDEKEKWDEWEKANVVHMRKGDWICMGDVWYWKPKERSGQPNFDEYRPKKQGGFQPIPWEVA